MSIRRAASWPQPLQTARCRGARGTAAAPGSASARPGSASPCRRHRRDDHRNGQHTGIHDATSATVRSVRVNEGGVARASRRCPAGALAERCDRGAEQALPHRFDGGVGRAGARLVDAVEDLPPMIKRSPTSKWRPQVLIAVLPSANACSSDATLTSLASPTNQRSTAKRKVPSGCGWPRGPDEDRLLLAERPGSGGAAQHRNVPQGQSWANIAPSRSTPAVRRRPAGHGTRRVDIAGSRRSDPHRWRRRRPARSSSSSHTW